MKKRLLIRSFLIIFFVLANITNLVTLPFTNAKYLKEDNFEYETSMYGFNPTFNVVNYPTTLEDNVLYANYKMSFTRNKMTYPGEHDYYTFYARINNQKNTCIVSANPKAVDDTGSATLTGNDTVNTMVVDVKCNITELTGSIPIHFNVVEQIDDDQVLPIGNIVKTYYNNDLLTYIRHDIDEGSVFDNWDGLRTDMRNYVDVTFKSNADFQNGVQLKGLSYDISTFTVEYDDNFPGYALTFSSFYPLVYTNTFYFTSNTNDEGKIENIQEDFEYYLKTYYGYDDEYIIDIEKYITFRTGESDIGLALTNVVNGTSVTIPGINRNNHSSGAYGIRFYSNLIPYIVNIKYGWDNYFRVEDYTGVNFDANYNNFVQFYGYSALVNNEILRGSFANIGTVDNGNDLSRLYILNSNDDSLNKLLVNVYRDNETLTSSESSRTYTFNYMSVTNLNGSPLTIKISNKDNFEFYDLVNGDGSSATYSDISDIINAIGDYVYGVDNYTYTSNVDEDGYMNVTYTLNN